jgi:hypothetical protein
MIDQEKGPSTAQSTGSALPDINWILLLSYPKQQRLRKLQISNATVGFEE